jgi:hypothetical protein
MSISEKLRDFAGSLSIATTDAPDEYPDWSNWTYETHMADLKALWMEIKPSLKRDIDQAEWVGHNLQEMFKAFDAGEKERGRKVALAIYNSDVKKLR